MVGSVQGAEYLAECLVVAFAPRFRLPVWSRIEIRLLPHPCDSGLSGRGAGPLFVADPTVRRVGGCTKSTHIVKVLNEHAEYHGNHNRSIDVDRAKALYFQGLGTTRIAKMLGHDPSAVWRALKREGIPTRQQFGGKRPIHP